MDAQFSADEVVFRRSGWIPQVIRRDGILYIRLGAGADANHEPRTFVFPISEAHLEVIKHDLSRHLLLWFAVLPLCRAAGTQDPFSDEAAMWLLDPILFGSEQEVEALFKENDWDTRALIAYNADAALLEKGSLFAALANATETANQYRLDEYNANRDRARRGVILSEIDVAILKYTGQYIHMSGLASRKPDAVDSAQLPKVLAIIDTAEQSIAHKKLTPADVDPHISKEKWNELSDTVITALTTHYPNLAEDTYRSVSTLMCSEAMRRARTP